MKYIIGEIDYCEFPDDTKLILATNRSNDPDGHPCIDRYLMTRAQFFARYAKMTAFMQYLQRKQAEDLIAALPKGRLRKRASG